VTGCRRTSWYFFSTLDFYCLLGQTKPVPGILNSKLVLLLERTGGILYKLQDIHLNDLWRTFISVFPSTFRDVMKYYRKQSDTVRHAAAPTPCGYQFHESVSPPPQPRVREQRGGIKENGGTAAGLEDGVSRQRGS